MEKKEIFKIAIKELRLQKGLTQEKLAEIASINEKYYGKIERGKSHPTLTIIDKICKALEIKISELMIIIENKEK